MARNLIFWFHLVVGIVAGVVVFILCLTGAILAFELQLIDFAERDARVRPVTPEAELLTPQDLVASAAKVDAVRIKSFEWFADSRMPVRLMTEQRRPLLLDPTTGELLGRGAVRLRGFLSWATGMHLSLMSQLTGEWIVTVSNACFVFLIVSGLWLWFPRTWRWQTVRNSVRLRFDLSGKARDWNWHNALGFWFLLPLLFIGASGLVLSFRPANQWWRSFGGQHLFSTPRPPTKLSPVAIDETGAVHGWWPRSIHLVQERYPDWRSIMINGSGAPNAEGLLTFVVHRGTQRHRRSTLYVKYDLRSGQLVEEKDWSSDDGPTRARAIARLGHTGEILGVGGQLLGFLACLAGCTLVYTGFALSWRRFFKRTSAAG